jgi:hypothetical protein
MALTNIAGPQVTYGITLSSSGIDMEHNPDRGPSYADLGEGLLDPRQPFAFSPGQASSKPFYGWAGLFGGPVVDQSPSATSSNVIAATQVPVGGTALTLNAVTSNGFGAAVTINAYEGGTVSIRPIDGAMTGLAFGVSGGPNLWNPTTAVARTLTVFGSSNGSSAEAWSVVGRDLYGQKMTELILGASNGQSSNVGGIGKKAWKYIASITPSTQNGAIGSTLVTVGTNDVYGFPLRVDHPGYVTAWAGPASSATLVTLSTGFHTLAVTSAATATTGDVRGTIATSGTGSVSNSSNWKIVMFISPSAQNLQAVSLGSSYPSGIVGLQQFSSV